MQPKRITIDGVIGTNEGEISSQFIKSQLPVNGTDPIEISIHSEGGSVFEGFAIYDALRAYPGLKKCVVASSAFSIASFIPMACDDVEITPNGYMMLHSPYSETGGTADEMMNKASLLAQMKRSMIAAYCEKTKKQATDFESILSKDTFLNAEQCLAYGLVNRITPAPITGRIFARIQSMPHGIVQALFGAGPSGDNREKTKEQSMSSQTPVAATVKQIKAAFPKAKSDFIVRAMEQEMPMEQVAATFATEAMSENEMLVARMSAMETEIAALKAASPSAPLPTQQPEATYEPEARAVAKSGVKPVAKAASSTPTVSAKVRWNQLVQAKIAQGMDRAKACRIANKENPEVREQLVAEANV